MNKCKKTFQKKHPKIEKRTFQRQINIDHSAKVLWSFYHFDSGISFPRDNSTPHFLEIATHLRDEERRSWNEILNSHKRDHHIDLTGLEPFARKRLIDLELDDREELFRFRFNGKQRLWGFIEEKIFYALWWDPDHQICKSTK